MMTDNDFDNKAVLVVGDVAAAGNVVAQFLARRGARLALVRDTASPSVTELEANVFVCDLTNAEELSRKVGEAVATLGGGLDVLIDVGPPQSWASGQLSSGFGSGVLRFLAVSEQVLGPMCDNGGGSIVVVVPHGDNVIAGAEKGSMLGLVRSLAVEYAPKGIRVNCVCPGLIESSGDVSDDRLERIPMKRPASVKDLAGAIAFLASDDSSYITGIALGLDGGATGNV